MNLVFLSFPHPAAGHSFFLLQGYWIVMSTHAPAEKGILFPPLSSAALDGSIVRLPHDALGSVVCIAIAFRRQAQAQVDSWLAPFTRVYGGDPAVRIYEIPMIGTIYGRLMAGRIDSGMRSGISRELHPFVITFYGHLAPYKKALDMPDSSLAYFFLLDREGRIRWRNRGRATEEGVKEMLELTSRLLREGQPPDTTP
jgi:hypothetical protein